MKKFLLEKTRVLVLVATLLTGLDARSQTAYDKLYFKGYNPSDLESINFDGTGRTVIYPSGSPVFGLEIDVPNQKVYWCDLNDNTIKRSNLDGSNVTVFLPEVTDAQGLSIDFVNQKFYWSSTSTSLIESVNLDGTGRATLVTSAFAGQPETIKVDATHQKLYWFDHNAYVIKRINLDGSGGEVFVNDIGNVQQMDIDEVNSKLYFPNWGPALLERINLDGTARTTVFGGFSTVGWPLALTVDKVNNKVYWWDGDAYRIKRVNTDGSNYEVFLDEIYSVTAMLVPTMRAASLPLRLLSFSGKETSNGNFLQWATADEVNTAAFDIERSSNGIEYIKIASILAGKSNTYSYTDNDPIISTTATYRLKVRDIDGKFIYSPIVSLKQTLSKLTSGYSVYPTPITGSFLYVKPLITANKADIQIEVVDVGGRTWYTHKFAAADLNSGRFEIPVKQLRPGSYVLHISDKNGVRLQVKQFVVGD